MFLTWVFTSNSLCMIWLFIIWMKKLEIWRTIIWNLDITLDNPKSCLSNDLTWHFDTLNNSVHHKSSDVINITYTQYIFIILTSTRKINFLFPYWTNNIPSLRIFLNSKNFFCTFRFSFNGEFITMISKKSKI